jgi:hypothetical protein
MPILTVEITLLHYGHLASAVTLARSLPPFSTPLNTSAIAQIQLGRPGLTGGAAPLREIEESSPLVPRELQDARPRALGVTNKDAIFTKRNFNTFHRVARLAPAP